jgi:pimeloyl-ACP methyl ester carboxylesterase
MDAGSMVVKGQELRYALFGPSGASRTLLAYNGIGASLEAIEPFAAHFRDTRIVNFDVPGVGGSPAPALPYRFTWIARLAAQLLDALGIAEVDVFGVS